jgi:hypothetical protein
VLDYLARYLFLAICSSRSEQIDDALPECYREVTTKNLTLVESWGANVTPPPAA